MPQLAQQAGLVFENSVIFLAFFRLLAHFFRLVACVFGVFFDRRSFKSTRDALSGWTEHHQATWQSQCGTQGGQPEGQFQE